MHHRWTLHPPEDGIIVPIRLSTFQLAASALIFHASASMMSGVLPVSYNTLIIRVRKTGALAHSLLAA